MKTRRRVPRDKGPPHGPKGPIHGLELTKSAEPTAFVKLAPNPDAGKSCGMNLLEAFMRHSPLSWAEAAVVIGIKAGNGYFYGGRKWLLENDLVHGSELGSITARGLELCKEQGLGYFIGLKPKRAELIDKWAGNLKKPGDLMLREINQSAAGLTQSELAARLGVKTGNGYWYGGLKALRTANLIETGDDGRIRLSAFLRSL